MPKYRKKPVVIEAVQFIPEMKPWPEGVSPYAERMPDSKRSGRCSKCERLYLEHGWINTLEGGHICCPGDYVITGVQGEKYPCKADVFEETYESVDEEEHE